MLLLSLPGTPFICYGQYYGEEIGMSGDKPDELIRRPMQWSAAVAGGVTTGTPWEPPQPDWGKRNITAHMEDDAGDLTLVLPEGQSSAGKASDLLRPGSDIASTANGMLTMPGLNAGEGTAVLLGQSG